MFVSVFGAGYVGSVSGACYAELGHHVTLVDIDQAKIAQIASGRSPIIEPGLDDLMARHVASGRLKATTDAATAVRDCDLSLVCVGTPSKPNGDIDLTFVVRVCEAIGRSTFARTF